MCNNCQNKNCEDCGHIGMEYCTDGFCEEKLDSKCVIYKHNQEESNLNCISDIQPNTSVEEILEIWDKELCNKSGEFRDEKVSVNGEDRAGYLIDKIDKGDCIITSVVQGKLKISLDFDCICSKLSLLNCTNTTPECNVLKPNITSSALSYCGDSSVTLIASNYEGQLQWFKNGNILIGKNSFSLVLEGEGGIFKVKNTTSCGEEFSNDISIVYTEDCSCNPKPTIPSVSPSSGLVNANETILLTASGCNGNISWYNSQNILIGEGATKAVGEGVYYARCTNNCGSANSNTSVISLATQCPPVTASITTKNPTCLGQNLQVNGEIVINNIINGNQISLNGSSYSALNQQGEFGNSHKYSMLGAGSYEVRIKPVNSNCSPIVYVVNLISTTCGCLPINSSIPTVIKPTCINGVESSNGKITVTSLSNVNRIYLGTSCNEATWNGATVVSSNAHTFENLDSGIYYIKYFYSENCFTNCSTVLVESDCCELNLSNPNIVC